MLIKFKKKLYYIITVGMNLSASSQQSRVTLTLTVPRPHWVAFLIPSKILSVVDLRPKVGDEKGVVPFHFFDDLPGGSLSLCFKWGKVGFAVSFLKKKREGAIPECWCGAQTRWGRELTFAKTNEKRFDTKKNQNQSKRKRKHVVDLFLHDIFSTLTSVYFVPIFWN